MTNLSICQDCKVNPATYGDGVTWARCSSCQLKQTQAQALPTPNAPQQMETEGFEHKTIPGLTSIIMPVYMVNYSLFHYTGNAIGSVREHTDKAVTPYELIIVDNGSPLKAPTLQSFYADKVVTHVQNLGVSVAWNKGIRISFGEYIVLINNDVQVFDGWLEELKRVIDEEGIDLVMAHPMYSLTEPFARATEAKKVLEGKYKFDTLERDFSCVMFKKELFDEIGGFDEQFFAYCQDSDFLKQMELKGKKFKVVDKVAIHHISDATGASIEETPDIMNQDKRKYEEKWADIQIDPVVQAAEEQLAQYPMSDGSEENRFIRTNETGDKIYLVEGNKVRWIKTAEKFLELGGEFGKEVTIPKEEFQQFERGEPIA